MKIIIAGDTMATNSNIELFEQGRVIDLVGQNIYERLDSADVVVANIEAPLYDVENNIKKFGPNLAAPCKSAEGLAGLKIGVANMGNNHIMDQGFAGLESTCKTLRNKGISCLGIGNNINEMKDVIYIESKGYKLGIYSCAEHEFSCADRKHAGANPFDPLVSYDRVTEIAAMCDYVIVLYHGGHEYYRLPSPELQRRCRKFIDHGADFIVTQHSHCIGAKENYKDREILYGQGNFIFDRLDNDYSKNSLLVAIDIQEQGRSEIEYIPIVKVNEKIRMADEKEKEEIMEMFGNNSSKVYDSDCLETMYDAFAEKNVRQYLRIIHGSNILMKIWDRLTGGKYISWLYSGKAGLGLLNYVECEAHNELLIRMIKRYLNGDIDSKNAADKPLCID